MNYAELLVGAGIGLGVSALIWWVQYRLIVPNLEFSPHISKLTSEHGAVYRFKVRNASKRRATVDVVFDVRLYLGHGAVGYIEGSVRTLQSLDVATRAGTIMYIGPGGSRVVRFDLRKAVWDGANPSYLQAAGISDVPDGGSVSLERLLETTEETYLRVRVLACDEVTGSRKFFRSGEYRLGDIKRGKFNGMRVAAWEAPHAVLPANPAPPEAAGEVLNEPQDAGEPGE